METSVKHVYLDGSILKRPSQVIQLLTKELCIPYSSGGWEQLHDWLCDLDWLPYNNIVIHFSNIDQLLKKYPRDIKYFWVIMNSFKDYWNKSNNKDSASKTIVFVFQE